MPRAPVAHCGFPPRQRAQIVQLACLEPVAKGLPITPWSSADLAPQAVVHGMVPAISAATGRRILPPVALPPHRTRYWKPARWDAAFKPRAERVWWGYSHAAYLAQQGLWVVCVDEIPNHHGLERDPIRRAIPGAIAQQAVEDKRHGTVTLWVFLVVHPGQMEIVILERKDAQHYIHALQQFRAQHAHRKGVFLIQDGAPSHTAGATQDDLAQGAGWWRTRYTPVHAAWLNQAEILIHSVSHRYLRRQSWHSRDAFLPHVIAAWPEYNDRYAKPIQWTWTHPKMRKWFAKHSH